MVLENHETPWLQLLRNNKEMDHFGLAVQAAFIASLFRKPQFMAFMNVHGPWSTCTVHGLS
jgi:hypothetical protein